MKNINKELRDIKGKIMHLEEEIKKLNERLETKFNTLKREVDDLAAYLNRELDHSKQIEETLKTINSLLATLSQLIDEKSKKKKRFRIF